VSWRKRSSAAAIAAASSGVADGAISSIAGRGGRRFPLVVISLLRTIYTERVTTIPVLDHDAVLLAVSPGEAIERVREAFVSFARGEWEMPPKIYLPSPPNGDFRAMPVRGEGLAILKWITSFPGNPRRGLPTVTGVVMVSDAETGEPVALLDARAVTALRTGAAASRMHLFACDSIAWAHRTDVFTPAFANSDAAQRGAREAALIVTGKLEVSLQLRRTIIDTQPQVFIRPVGLDDFSGIHFPIRIPDRLELMEGTHEFRTEHFG